MEETIAKAIREAWHAGRDSYEIWHIIGISLCIAVLAFMASYFFHPKTHGPSLPKSSEGNLREMFLKAEAKKVGAKFIVEDGQYKFIFYGKNFIMIRIVQ